MKNLFFFALFLVVSLLIVGSRYFVFPEDKGTTEKGSELPVEKKALLQGYENAVWDWRSLERTDVNGFLEALRARGITTVYLNVGDYVDLYEMADSEEKQRKIEDFNAKVKNYLVLAKEEELAVHALAGGTNWGNASHRYLNKVVLDYIRDFNESNADIAFQGVQFDIEPYSQEGYSLQKSQDIFAQYLDTVEEIVAHFSNLQAQSQQLASMRIGFVIPYWFDGQDEYAQRITWHGEEKYLFYHLLNRLNRVQNGSIVIMAYRNFAEGTDGIVEHVQNEISFSRQYTPRIKMIIGQETSDVKPQKITYFGKPFDAMLEEVKKVGLKFENSLNVTGFAFNNADSFLEMK